MDMKELFENNCFPMSWSSEAEDVQEYEPLPQQRKDLNTLLAELEDIKNHIEDIKAKQWYLAKLMKFHREGIQAG